MVSALQGRLVALVGVVGLIGLLVADAVGDHFWNRHALITSLVANLVVVLLTVGVVNEVLDRRARRHWTGLAQYVMVELVRTSRVTWTFLADLGGLMPEADGRGASEMLSVSREIGRDTPALRRAMAEILADPVRRAKLGEVLEQIGRVGREVIASWAGLMIASPAYATVFDRHVELLTRVTSISTLFAHFDDTQPDSRRRRIAGTSIAVEVIEHVDDAGFESMLVSIVGLALKLDEETTALALTLVPSEEWVARTADLGGVSPARANEP